MRSTTRTAAALAALAAAGLGTASAAQAAPAGRTPVAAARPAKGGTDQGAVSPGKPVSLRLYLAPNGGQAALDRAVAAVSTPGSAQYGQTLTPAQYRATYEPTDATVAAVTQAVSAAGLKVTAVERYHRYVTVTGKASAIDAAFGSALHQFTQGGETYDAPTATATLPSTLSGKVAAVAGLSTKAHVVAPAAQQPPAFVNGTPCSTYYGEKRASDLPAFQGATLPYAPCGYVPTQLRSAYEGATALTGAGTTVAITDAYASPTILQDANTYATRHGDAAFAAGQLEQRNAAKFVLRKDCDQTGWYGEETLDVEAVHGMAPAAKVLYYGSASCTDPDFGDTLDRVVDDGDASVVSNSWSDLEANETPDGIVAYEQAFEQGALQGQSFLFSSGDDGDEVASSGTKQVDYPASDPYATGIGGTATGIGRTGALTFQTGWGTQRYDLANGAWTTVGYLYGAGGGSSVLFAKPGYQAGTATTAGRGVPDVAMDADPTTGMLVGETQKFPTGGNRYGEYRIGGTSLASPLMAGMQALREQAAGRRGGFLNPTLYGPAKGELTDVAGPGPDAGNVRSDFVNGIDASGGMTYTVRTFDQDSSLGANGAVTPGWDSITGIGVPSTAYLAGR